MDLGRIGIKVPKETNNYLWKYIDHYKLTYFLRQRSLYFTRLDKLDDPSEGALLFSLKAKYNATTYNNPKHKKLIDYEKNNFDAINKTSCENEFVNCWFYGDRESIAMWNLHSSTDSEVLGITFQDFYPTLIKSFQRFISNHGNRMTIIGDLVSYYKLNLFEKGLKIKPNYKAFNKDVSYRNESEYRFLVNLIRIYTESNVDSYEIPIDEFEKLRLDIITHPKMQVWKKNNIK